MRLSRERVSIAVVLALMVAALAMMALGFSGYSSAAGLWNAVFAGPEDGSWTAISIDGRPVEPEQYRIAIRNGEVSGGRDGCNDWSYDEEGAKDGDRMIISTLVGCPEGDPLREAYWSIVADPTVELISGQPGAGQRASDRPNPLKGKLRVSGRGHEAMLIRCRWQRVRETLPGGGISDMMRCLPVEEDR